MAKRPRVANQISRRSVLGGLAAVPLASTIRSADTLAKSPPIFLSCADDRARDHYVVGFDLAGMTRFAISLPARGHGFAIHPDAPPMVFARRPGSFALALDARAGQIVASIAPPKARCFYGHGTYSASGALLYICEHDVSTGNGFIGVYDARAGFRRLGDFAAGGVGPHQACLMPDGKTLAVAVGGIQTDAARDKLNIESMDPSLAYLDASTGHVLEQVRPPADWHQLSIRHIDVDAHGRVALAMQFEGDVGEAVPLAALHARGAPALTFLRAPEDAERRLKHYLGDIAFGADGRTIAATSPVGSAVASWNSDGRFLALAEAADGCGILGLAETQGAGFLVSGGDGRLRRIGYDADAEANAPRVASNWLWDNHFCVV